MFRPQEGRCACGAVRYRMNSAPMFVNCCHCTDCQRQTGGAFAVNAVIETDRLDILTGEPAAFAMPTESGRPHTVFRCVPCGTAVWSEYGDLRTLRFLRVCTLDNPRSLPPQAHIYTRSKLPWVALPEAIPAFDGYYDSAKLWPVESLQRRRAALP